MTIHNAVLVLSHDYLPYQQLLPKNYYFFFNIFLIISFATFFYCSVECHQMTFKFIRCSEENINIKQFCFPVTILYKEFNGPKEGHASAVTHITWLRKRTTCKKHRQIKSVTISSNEELKLLILNSISCLFLFINIDYRINNSS